MTDNNACISVIGVTGQVGSGKSTFARMICTDSGMFIGADQIAKSQVDNSSEIQEKIRNTFGKDFFDDKGQLKRRDLGRLVFTDFQSLQQLNCIVWPSMINEIKRRIHHARMTNTLPVILDMAVLFETDLDGFCDVIIAVISSDAERIRRLKALRKWTEEEVLHRQTNQLDADTLVERSDIIIHNDGSLDELKRKADEVTEYLNL